VGESSKGHQRHSLEVANRRGRPRKRPAHLIADKGYSYPACRQLLRQRGIYRAMVIIATLMLWLAQ
jgi:hypothetical protein